MADLQICFLAGGGQTPVQGERIAQILLLLFKKLITLRAAWNSYKRIPGAVRGEGDAGHGDCCIYGFVGRRRNQVGNESDRGD